eukprot:scaffold452389_cov48-Prasinocladus_malaysianus.AAC.1
MYSAPHISIPEKNSLANCFPAAKISFRIVKAVRPTADFPVGALEYTVWAGHIGGASGGHTTRRLVLGGGRRPLLVVCSYCLQVQTTSYSLLTAKDHSRL